MLLNGDEIELCITYHDYIKDWDFVKILVTFSLRDLKMKRKLEKFYTHLAVTMDVDLIVINVVYPMIFNMKNV